MHYYRFFQLYVYMDKFKILLTVYSISNIFLVSVMVDIITMFYKDQNRINSQLQN